MSTGLNQSRTGLNDGGRVGYVFKHFHAGNRIESSGLFRGECFNGYFSIIDFLARFEKVKLGNF